MTDYRGPGVLRWLAALLIRGPEAEVILAELDDAMEGELARGIPLWRARWRYGVNVFGSALSVWRTRARVPKFGFSWLDVKLGLRMLVKYPGLTFVAVFALAVGIPVGMAPMHIVKAVQAPPPVHESDRIQVLRHIDAERNIVEPTSLYDFLQWREELTSFDALGAAIDDIYNVISEDGRAAPIEGAEVTAAVFDILRVPPLYGRTLVPGDEVNGAPDVVVIGHDLWQSRLGGDPEAVGQVIRVGGVRRTVVGVMPKDFIYPWDDHIWIPLRGRAFLDDHGQERRLRVFGRLSNGVSPDEAETELIIVGRRMALASPEVHEHLRPQVVPFTIGMIGIPKGGVQAMPAFYLIQILALLMLVFPCVNIGMLILARTLTRSTELAVRTALGASRRRVILQLFVESLVLALLAAGLGLLIVDQILSRVDDTFNWIDLGLTPQTALWALALAGFSAAIVGVVPALKVTGKNISRNMRDSTAGRRGVRFGGISSTLIVVDLALAISIIGASVGIWGTDRPRGMGIQADQFLSAELRVPRLEVDANGTSLGQDERARLGATQEALVRRLAAEPGVGGVAVASVLPGLDHPIDPIEVDGDGSRHRVRIAQVDAGFFEALDQPILNGRGFDLGDLGSNRTTVIVNTSFVEQVLGGRNPIGRRVRRWTRGENDGPWYEIVGVVGHLGMFASDAERDAGVYFPLAPGEIYPIPFAIRVGDDPESFTPRLRALASEADPTAIIWAPVALNNVFSALGFLGALARWYVLIVIGILLTISTLAIYALMSFTVAQRKREIGVRIALGAGWPDVVATIAKRALVQLGLGALVGMTISAGMLYVLNIEFARVPMESPVLVASLVTVGVVILIATLACVAPTLRALRISPTEALREGG